MVNFNFKRKPFAKQLEALEISYNKPNFALFMEQGTGKSKVTLDTANYLYENKIIDTLLVVAWPNGVHRNWVDIEISKDVIVPFKASFWQASLSKQKKDDIRDVFYYKNGLRIMTYNIEAVNTDNGIKNIMQFLDSGKCMFVIDQSACIKNPDAKRTKILIKLGLHRNVVYKRILDGDPVAEGLHEYYTQFKFLDEKIIGLRSFFLFKSEFCNIGFFKNIIGYKNVDKLQRLIEPYSFRCRAEECLDLPDRIYKRWIFSLNNAERKIFDDMKQNNISTFICDNNNEHVSFEKMALTKNMRLQQISSGWFNSKKDFEDSELIPISAESSRLSAFKELIKNAQGKVLIFARFIADLKVLEKLLGDEAVSYRGGISEDLKAEAKHRFMNDDKIKYFIGQPTTAGIGHTLTIAKHIVFYSNSHSLRLRKECEKRVHRTGLKHHVIIWDLIAEETQDANIVKCLIDKKKISDQILKDPENFFLRELIEPSV